ncbi:endolysin [Gordonia phage GMA2]|uniref:Putative lysin n=1 Tax=Gordonia phage GMA2 TaxID=1647283 RepID=A0A0K0N6L7_9CAUD|nr:endolysin [Gordonia phage GMA2]AKJ72574.1 putative lysin [Gordonia phage GMA2]
MTVHKDLTGISIPKGGTSGMWNAANTIKQVIVIHDTESGNAAGALNWMRSQQNGSYHILVDTDGDSFRMVPDSRQAWAAAATGNRIGLHVCATGYASWRLKMLSKLQSDPKPATMAGRVDNPKDGICTDTGSRRASTVRWADHPAMLEIIAQNVAQWSVTYNIPLRILNAEQVRAGLKGICGHNEISLAFRQTDHTDPGVNFPKTRIVARAIEIVSEKANLLGLTDSELAEVARNFNQLGPA